MTEVHIRNHYRRCMVAIVLTLLMALSLTIRAAAAELTNRAVIITTAVTGAVTDHQFKFNFVSPDDVGSVAFQYCTTPLYEDTCAAPSGLDASNATLSSQFGQTGFVLGTTSSNSIIISRNSASVVPGAAGYSFNNVVNGSLANTTTFVRISTYASNDGNGPVIDKGTVAFTLAPSLAVSAFVPPFLAMCAGVTVSIGCDSSNGNGINLGHLLATQAATGTTQVAAATNDASGYALTAEGTTLTSGNNVIPALNQPTISSPGTGQFGINLRANSSPAVGNDEEGTGTAIAAAGYGQANLFKYHPGDTIISASTSTNYNRFTVSYLVNIPFGQPAGVYTTTLTYLATASF